MEVLGVDQVYALAVSRLAPFVRLASRGVFIDLC